VGLVAKAEVTPLGKSEAASVTLPLNPFTSLTVNLRRAQGGIVSDHAEDEFALFPAQALSSHLSARQTGAEGTVN
jgi:hypothetical protein